MMRGLFSCLLVLSLSGCAATQPAPQVSYYQLPDSREDASQGSVVLPAQRLSVVRVSTTDILAQTGIVTAGTDARVVVANYHHWSELPEFALQHSLNHCLREQTVRQSGKISLELDAFQSDGAGGALFAGVWHFAPASAPRAAQPYRFTYRQAIDDDGYPALVDALAVSVDQLCKDIVKQLS